MKFLFAIHYPVFGGPHNQALRLAGVLRERGWETLVLLPDEPGNAAARLREGGVEVWQAPLSRLRAAPDLRLHVRLLAGLPSQIARIRRILREHEIDLVLIGGLVNPHAAVAARLEGVPVVWQILDTRPPMTLRRALMPLVLKVADAVMFDGNGLLDLHLGRKPIPQPTFIYYPPVDTMQFMPNEGHRNAIRDEFGIPRDEPLVGMVANLNPQKGIEYFVRAAGIIYKIVPDTRFLVVGAYYDSHRDYADEIAAEVRAARIPEDRFIFTGARADVEKFYPAMDVKLITSVPRSEGTTTTAMEAMACGVPVVATDVGAVREVVEDSVTGFVVPPQDPEAIARATLRLLGDPDLRRRMGKAARERAIARYDVETCAATHIRAFEAAIAHHRLRKGRVANVV